MTTTSKIAKADRAKPRHAHLKTTSKDTPQSKAKNAGAALAPAAPDTRPPVAPLPPSLKQPSKQDKLAAMLVRDEGATLDAMVEATGWLKHTVRAALTGLKKKGFAVSSDKVDGLRAYRAVAPE